MVFLDEPSPWYCLLVCPSVIPSNVPTVPFGFWEKPCQLLTAYKTNSDTGLENNTSQNVKATRTQLKLCEKNNNESKPSPGESLRDICRRHESDTRINWHSSANTDLFDRKTTSVLPIQSSSKCQSCDPNTSKVFPTVFVCDHQFFNDVIHFLFLWPESNLNRCMRMDRLLNPTLGQRSPPSSTSESTPERHSFLQYEADGEESEGGMTWLMEFMKSNQELMVVATAVGLVVSALLITLIVYYLSCIVECSIRTLCGDLNACIRPVPPVAEDDEQMPTLDRRRYPDRMRGRSPNADELSRQPVPRSFRRPSAEGLPMARRRALSARNGRTRVSSMPNLARLEMLPGSLNLRHAHSLPVPPPHRPEDQSLALVELEERIDRLHLEQRRQDGLRGLFGRVAEWVASVVPFRNVWRNQ